MKTDYRMFGSKEIIGFFTTECSVGKSCLLILSLPPLLGKSRLKEAYCSIKFTFQNLNNYLSCFILFNFPCFLSLLDKQNNWSFSPRFSIYLFKSNLSTQFCKHLHGKHFLPRNLFCICNLSYQTNLYFQI